MSADSFARPLVEPHVAVDPRNPSHLVAAAIVASAAANRANDLYCAAFASFDGGRSWTSSAFAPREGVDPWVAIGRDGLAFAVMIGFRGDSAERRFGAFLFRSEDGGRAWAPEPTFFAGGHDHPAVAVDATGGRFDGRVYVISGRSRRLDGKSRFPVFVARSTDQGRTFHEPVQIVPNNLNLNSDNGVVLSDGTLALTYTEFQRNVDGFARGGVLERKHTWVVTSADGGDSFSVPLFVSESCGPGFKTLAVDTSAGRFRNRLYLVCTKPGGNGIYLHSSGDGGERWSNPVRVDRPGDENDLRRTPGLAVNRDGVVGIAWYDRRDDPDRRCQHLYFTASLDGGATFLPEVRVTDVPSCPSTPRNGAAAERWPMGSDYGAVAAGPDGLFHVLWADSRSGIYQLWTTTVKVAAGAR
ncbi:MAG: sialidase family protein [Candidatus Eiseniibacteriota bacterium]